jgi:26S proteasome regulatory subunit N6
MSDPIIRTHFTSLYDNLLEQNLLRIVEPFSRVEVAHVAALVGLPVVEIEFKYTLSSRRVNRQVESDDSG